LVRRLRNNPMVDECSAEKPMNCPTRACGTHLRILLHKRVLLFADPYMRPLHHKISQRVLARSHSSVFSCAANRHSLTQRAIGPGEIHRASGGVGGAS
jgi:hypothetical protein